MNFWKMLKALFTSAPRCAPDECGARIRSGAALLIDVREPDEWAAGVAQHAVLLPFSDLAGRRTQWQPFLAAHPPDKELLVYCHSGGRSALAARMLSGEGFRTANAGGFSDWVAAGWPVVAPAKSK